MVFVQLLGTIAFALAGTLVGVRKRLDLLGVGIVASLTAVGGGVMRDVLLGAIPRVFSDVGTPLWQSSPLAVLVTLVLAAALRLHRIEDTRARELFVVADSMGLVAFAIAGADAGIAHGLNLFGVATLAFVTAVGGGLVRDALVNEVPAILHEDFYGTIALLVGLALGGLRAVGVDHRPWLGPIFFVALALRLYAVRAGLRLPRLARPAGEGDVGAGDEP